MHTIGMKKNERRNKRLKMLQNSQKWHSRRKIYLCRMVSFSSFFIVSMILILTSNRKSQDFLFGRIFTFLKISTNYHNNVQITKDFIGILLLLLILVLFLSVYFYLFEREFINSCNDMIAVSTVLILNLLLVKFLIPIPAFAIPAFMGIVLISLLIDVRIAIVINIVVSIITLLVVGDKNFDFALYLFIGGSLSSIVSHKIQSRIQFISHGFLSSLISALFVLAIELVYQTDGEMILYNSINSFVVPWCCLIISNTCLGNLYSLPISTPSFV